MRPHTLTLERAAEAVAEVHQTLLCSSSSDGKRILIKTWMEQEYAPKRLVPVTVFIVFRRGECLYQGPSLENAVDTYNLAGG